MVQWWSSLFNICSAKEIHAMFLLRFDPLRRRFQKWGKREIFSGLSQKLWLMVWLVFVIELWSSQSKYLHERLSWLSAQHVCIKSNDFTGKLEKLIIKARLKALKKSWWKSWKVKIDSTLCSFAGLNCFQSWSWPCLII